MEAPVCRHCGKRHWERVCALLREAVPAIERGGPKEDTRTELVKEVGPVRDKPARLSRPIPVDKVASPVVDCPVCAERRRQGRERWRRWRETKHG